MMTSGDQVPGQLAEALANLQAKVTECSQCCTLTTLDRNPCALCSREGRDESQLLVVEHPQDVLAFERTGEFKGRYHVLHGAISPLDGVTPDRLRIKPMLARVQAGGITEVIVATDPDVEGDATAMYLARLLKPLGLRTSRLAHGISVGTNIEYADTMTLARALEHRRDL